MMRRLLPLWLILAFLGLLFGSGAQARPSPDPRVMTDVWAQFEEQSQADVLLRFPQPDLSPAYSLTDKTERGTWVYRTLRGAAQASQAPVWAALQRMGISYRPFWVVNAIQARVTKAQLARLLAFPQIERVDANPSFRALAPPPETNGSLAATAMAEPPWGVQRVGAPELWAQGIVGQGVVVAGQDTGYDWTHPALQHGYRGYDPATGAVSHDYQWHDAIHEIDPHNSGTNPCGVDSPYPCDDHGHGTHTMGTMMGNDLDPTAKGWPAAAAHPIGVAPGARWIGCRNMERGWGRPSTYIECFQWFVAPWPVGGNAFSQGDPSLAPDIINNSWSCPPDEGCTASRLDIIESALNAADAAGILVVVSAQNAGPHCSTIQDPPALYPKALTVGATDVNDQLAVFSSRGPIHYQNQTRIGPDISAPGVGIESSIPQGLYASMSGTSMAGPHVAGVAALLLSARPELRGRPEAIRGALTRWADHLTTTQGCGNDTPESIPNNGYGWGIVNAHNILAFPMHAFLPIFWPKNNNP